MTRDIARARAEGRGTPGADLFHSEAVLADPTLEPHARRAVWFVTRAQRAQCETSE